MKRIAVYCGSSCGIDNSYEETAFMVGQTLAARNIGLVYGGTNVGLMNAVAIGALSKKGEVIGVIPGFIRERGLARPGLTRLLITETMHERKKTMSDLSDGFIALPGGFGTLEEFFEILTWGQLGLHKKPAGILNSRGFFDPLMDFIQKMVDEGFLKTSNQEMLLLSDDIEDLLAKMESYIAPSQGKWIFRDPVT